ncbi:MAG: trigger factor [Minisyncoccota bacterium]
MPHKNFNNLKTRELPDAEVEITGEIALSFLVVCRAEALKNLNASVKIDGFRSGHIPEDVLIKKIGEVSILEESAEIALGKEYPNIIKELKINAIGRPMISVTKIAPGIPLEFKIVTAVEPDFELPDYQKIAKEIGLTKEEIKILDKEVEDVMVELKKHNINPELKEGEKLEDKIKENILMEKQFKSKEKRRLAIIERLVKETKMDVPKVLIESEILKMIGQFKDDVARAGLKWEDYLKQAKKTEEEIEKEWRPKALDRAKAELIVGKIAEKEKIEPTNEELEHETKHLLSHYKDADPLRARVYVYQTMRNEKVLEFLEEIK